MITSQNNYVSYTPNGIATVFAVPFRFLEANDLTVSLTDVDGNVTVLSSGFTASGVDNPAGGTITFAVAPVGSKLEIVRLTDAVQVVDYVDNDAFKAESHEKQMDRTIMAIQDRVSALERVDRSCLRVQPNETLTAFAKAAERLGLFCGFDPITGDARLYNASEILALSGGAPTGIGLPPGGGVGAMLQKLSGTSYDVGWFTTTTIGRAIMSAGSAQAARDTLGLPILNVNDWGLVGDAQMRKSASITVGTTTINIPGGGPTADAVGKFFRMEGAGAAGGDLTGQITGWTSTSFTINTPALTTSTNKPILWGTDNTATGQVMLDAANNMVPRPILFWPGPAYLGNWNGHREFHFLGTSTGSLSDFTTDNLSNPQWATTLFPAVTTAPVLYFDEAFGVTIERLVFANTPTKVGVGVQVGPLTGNGYYGMNIIMNQVAFLGFNKAIRLRHCNETLINGINIVDCTNGIWFGADNNGGGSTAGHAGVSVRGIQTIRVDYPFNTATGVGMRVTVNEGDFNFGIRLANLQLLSFFNATTINVEDFAGSPLIEMYDAANTVDICGITRLRSDVPIVRNYSSGTNVRITGDIGSGIYQSCGLEYPDHLSPNMSIERYSSSAFTTLLQKEWAPGAYKSVWRSGAQEYKENWSRNLDSTSAGYTVNNGIGQMGWQRTHISGTAFQTTDGNISGPAAPGAIAWHSSGVTTAGTAARLALGQNNLYIDGTTNYFRYEFAVWNNTATANTRFRYGLYSLAAVTMTPANGVGLVWDPSQGSVLSLEMVVAGVTTRVPTILNANTFNSPTAIKVRLERNFFGIFMTLYNHITGAILCPQVTIAPATVPPNVALAPCFLTEIYATGAHISFFYPNIAFRYQDR